MCRTVCSRRLDGARERQGKAARRHPLPRACYRPSRTSFFLPNGMRDLHEITRTPIVASTSGITSAEERDSPPHGLRASLRAIMFQASRATTMTPPSASETAARSTLDQADRTTTGAVPSNFLSACSWRRAHEGPSRHDADEARQPARRGQEREAARMTTALRSGQPKSTGTMYRAHPTTCRPRSRNTASAQLAT